MSWWEEVRCGDAVVRGPYRTVGGLGDDGPMEAFEVRYAPGEPPTEFVLRADGGERRYRAVTWAAHMVVSNGATGHCSCGSCGDAIDPWDNYCKHCGAVLEGVAR